MSLQVSAIFYYFTLKEVLMQHAGASLLARYNSWMNKRLMERADVMGSARIEVDQQAYFSSIFGSFQHIMVGDLVWLRCYGVTPAFASLATSLVHFPEPTALNAPLYKTWAEFKEARLELDQLVSEWIQSLDDHSLQTSIHYASIKGIKAWQPLWILLTHLFNHQTHHRGQITTLMMQQGYDPGVTDMVAMLREV